MIKLSNERMGQMLHEETVQKEDTTTILRTIYTRFMNLYEAYFDDINALTDEKVAEFRNYRDETESLIKYYYLDIPMDVCLSLKRFDHKYNDKLLGPDWHEYLFESYADFVEDNEDEYETKEEFMKEFKKEALDEFYDLMDRVFRDGYGTGSETAKNALSTIHGFLFGKSEEEK